MNARRAVKTAPFVVTFALLPACGGSQPAGNPPPPEEKHENPPAVEHTNPPGVEHPNNPPAPEGGE